jgi:hypothetical protein
MLFICVGVYEQLQAVGPQVRPSIPRCRCIAMFLMETIVNLGNVTDKPLCEWADHFEAKCQGQIPPRHGCEYAYL